MLVDVGDDDALRPKHESLLVAMTAYDQQYGALVVAGRDVASLSSLVDRIVILHDGRLTQLTRTPVRRVAERYVVPRPPITCDTHGS